MAITIGHGSAVEVGEESTWGTAVTTTHMAVVSSVDLSKSIDRKAMPHLGKGDIGSTTAQEFVDGLIEAGGSFSHPLYYDDPTSTILLAHALGKVAESGAGPYVHSIDLAVPTNTALKGLTLGDRKGREDMWKYEGVVISRTEITVRPGEPVIAKFDVLAEDKAAAAAQTSLTYQSSPEAVMGQDFGVLAWNSVNHIAASITIRIDRKFERRPVLGTQLTLQPLPSDRATVEIEAELEYGVSTQPDGAWLTKTASNVTFTATGTSNNAILFTGHGAEVMSIGDPVAAHGRILRRVVWACKGSAAATSGISIDVTNDVATYNASAS